MMYKVNASGITGAPGEIKDLWPAGSEGTRLRIQNQSFGLLEVIVTVPDVGGIAQPPVIIELPTRGSFTDQTWVDQTCAVAVRSYNAREAKFHAVRML